MSEVKNWFAELNAINVNDKVEKKGRFSYVSWSDAVEMLFLRDPKATWEFHPIQWFGSEGNQTALVSCTVHAFDKSVYMYLSVINNQNKAILNPNAHDINNSMMRCLTKAIACHGIGLYIYRGEDLPSDDISTKPDSVRNKPVSKKPTLSFRDELFNAVKAKKLDVRVVTSIIHEYGVETPNDLPEEVKEELRQQIR